MVLGGVGSGFGQSRASLATCPERTTETVATESIAIEGRWHRKSSEEEKRPRVRMAASAVKDARGGIVVGVPFMAINKALQRILFEVVNLCGWSTFGHG